MKKATEAGRLLLSGGKSPRVTRATILDGSRLFAASEKPAFDTSPRFDGSQIRLESRPCFT
jgi:hypothetical protein